MPRQPLIIDHHFYHAKGTGKNSLASGVHHADYIVDEKKTELLVDDRTTLQSAAIHAQYADEREGSMGSFGSVSTEQAKKEIAAHTESPVFRLIIAVGEEDALAMDNGLTTKAGWEKAITAAMPDAIRAMGLDPAKVEWTAAAHRRQHGGENNPHVHLLIWERGKPSRRTGVFDEPERHAIQKSFAKVLYRPELDRIGAQKTQARDQSKALTRAIFDGMELEQGFVNALTDRLATLGSHLPPKGRLAYAYLPPTIKTEVMDLAHWLSETQPDLKAAKAAFLDSAKEFAGVYWSPPGSTEWGGPKQAAKRQAALDAAIAKADQDFHQRLVADLLRAATRTPVRQHDATALSAIERRLNWEPTLSGIAEDASDAVDRDSMEYARVGRVSLRDAVQAACRIAAAELMPEMLSHGELRGNSDRMDGRLRICKAAVMKDAAVAQALEWERQRLEAEMNAQERGSDAAKTAYGRWKHLNERVDRQIQRQLQRTVRQATQQQINAWWRQEEVQEAWRAWVPALREAHDATTRISIQIQAEQALKPLAEQVKLTSEYAKQLIQEGLQRRLDAYGDWWSDHHRIEQMIAANRRWKAQARRDQVEPLAKVIRETDHTLRTRWHAATVVSETDPPQTPYRVITQGEAKTVEAQAPSGPPREAQSAVATLARDPVPKSPPPTIQVGLQPPPPSIQPPPAFAGLSHRPGPTVYGLATVPWQTPPTQFQAIRPEGASLAKPTYRTAMESRKPTQYIVKPEIAKQRQTDLQRQVEQHVSMIGQNLRWQQSNARARTTQLLLRALFMGLRGDDGRYQAYLSAKERYQKEKAEWELAQAQGIQIAR